MEKREDKPIDTTAKESRLPPLLRAVDKLDAAELLSELEVAEQRLINGEFGDLQQGEFDTERFENYLQTHPKELLKLMAVPGTDLGSIGDIFKKIAEGREIEALTSITTARERLKLQETAKKLAATITLGIEVEKAKLNTQIVQEETNKAIEAQKQRDIEKQQRRDEAQSQLGQIEFKIRQTIQTEKHNQTKLTEVEKTRLTERRIRLEAQMAEVLEIVEMNTIYVGANTSIVEKGRADLEAAKALTEQAIEKFKLELTFLFAHSDVQKMHAIERIVADTDIDVANIRANGRREIATIQTEREVQLERRLGDAQHTERLRAADRHEKEASLDAVIAERNHLINLKESDRHFQKTKINNFLKHNGKRIKVGVATVLAISMFSNFVDDNPKYRNIPLTHQINGLWDAIVQPINDGLVNLACELPLGPDCRNDTKQASSSLEIQGLEIS